MNKFRVGLLSGLIAIILSLPIQTQAAEVTAGTDIATAYVWRGIVFNDEGVMQPSVDVAHDSGLSFNVWGNFDLGDFNDTLESGEFSEIDLTLSYALPVEVIDLSIGTIWYLFPEAGADSATQEIFLSLGLEPFADSLPGLSIGGDIYLDIDEVNDVYANIWISQSINSLFPDKECALSTDITASFGFAGDEFATAYSGTDSGAFDWNIGVSSSYPITETLELSLFINAFGSLDDQVLPDQPIDIYGGGGLYYSF